MRKFWSGVLAATFVASVSVAAAQEQAPRPSSPGGAVGTAGDQAPAPARGAAQAGASKSITVSGCIQNAPAAAAKADAGGAAASASAGSKFILAMKPAGGAAGGGAVGTAGSTATRYQLDGDEKAISPHLNHQVEVTGTLDAAASAGAAGPTLKVESVKMVSATCS